MTDNWHPIRIRAHGLQPQTVRDWECYPAWDITAVHAAADAELPHPDYFRAQEGRPGEHSARERRKYIFWDRHIDRRFSLLYTFATAEGPRETGRTIGEPLREWFVLIETRDQYLREAGLGAESSPAEASRFLAETFGWNSYFQHKPMCAAFPENPRSLCHPIEGLLHKSFCVGCAKAYMALVDSLGLPARNIGCGAHWVVEVLVDGRWHMADSIGRHEKNAGLDLYFKSSFVDMYLDPMGEHGENLSDGFRDGLWRRPNPQFHFHDGMWGGPRTLRYAASNAFALYPNRRRWGLKSEDGKRLPVIARANGFYWPSVHESDGAALRELRRRRSPVPLTSDEELRADYLFHRFDPGQALRQSFFIGALDDLEALEVTLVFAAPPGADLSAETGNRLALLLNDWRVSLSELEAWPPTPVNPQGDAQSGGLYRVHATLPPHALVHDAVNWLTWEQGSDQVLHAPVVPAVAEPYIAPLGRM